MFGFLKKKITSFIDQLTKKEEHKNELQTSEKQHAQPVSAVELKQPKPAAPFQPASQFGRQSAKTTASAFSAAPAQTLATRTTAPGKPYSPADQLHFETKTVFEKAAPTVTNTPTKTIQTPAQEPQHAAMPATRLNTPVEFHKLQPSQTRPQTTTPQKNAKPAETKTPETVPKNSVQIEPQKERKLEAKLGLFSQIKGLITREVQIQPFELEPMLDELNLALLESDVTFDTAEHITSTIKAQLSGKKVEKNRVQAEIQAAVKTALVDVLGKPPLDLVDYIRSHEKPVKILFLGPNGAGKTTTLAKIAFFLKQNNLRCVLAAADTFRAAAIEQLQHHGSAIGVPVIKHQYGADPAAVAFDAISHAKSHGADVVLIDTAGRQETNYNLLKEMEKINRVVKPDLKLFIGEAVAGHALVEQAKAFHQSLKLDGVVLTKIDCDAKGGTSFSVSHEVGVPIVLLGTGQAYGDLRAFDPAWLVSNVLAD